MSLLGIHNSATGHQWNSLPRETQDAADKMVQLATVDPILANIVARLGGRMENLDGFLDPKLRNLLPDPKTLAGVEGAADRLSQAIKSRERIAIFGDYDVDGAASSALLIDHLRYYQIEPTLYIPDRQLEGYGPNVPAMQNLAAEHSLIICVDCGSLANEPIAAARKMGADVMVLDHHMGGVENPDALMVNPNRQDAESDLGHLCAAAVVFLVLVAQNATQDAPRPDLIKALDLVALATVADVAPLIGVNRAFVRTGLQVMQLGERMGLYRLIESSMPGRVLDAQAISFTLAPILNAGGRVGRSVAATQLLTARNETEAENLTAELIQENKNRRIIEAKITEAAIAQAQARGTAENLAYAWGEDWHSGVLGIVASRMKSQFGKPAIAMGVIDGVAHGSARSVEGVDLGGAIVRLVDEGLVTKGGGHKMAAGLSLPPEKIEPAMIRLDHLLARQFSAYTPQLTIDSLLSPEALTLNLVDEIEAAGPYGAAAAQPIFVIANVYMTNRRILKERHIKYQFRSGSGYRFDVISFGCVGSNLEIPEANSQQPIHLAVTVSRNEWNGRETVSLQLADWANIDVG